MSLQNEKTTKYKNKKNLFKLMIANKLNTFLALLFVIAIAVFGVRLASQPFSVKISGQSMYPTLKNNESLTAFNNVPLDFHSKPKRGEIIVFNGSDANPRETDKGRAYIKRVIGVPGDTVSYDGENIAVNGKVINQSFISEDAKINSYEAPVFDGDTNFLYKWDLGLLSTHSYNGTSYWNSYSVNTKTVPKGMYFVLGDNRKVSNDSREFGYVKGSDIKGIVKTGFLGMFPDGSESSTNINDISF